MSGGVDSSVAAALLLEQGYDVTGVTLKLWGGESDSGCCSVADVEDARRVAAQLGIPHYVFNFTDDFDDAVVDPYVDEHAAGRTPESVRGVQPLDQVRAAPRARRRARVRPVATGHHARDRAATDGTLPAAARAPIAARTSRTSSTCSGSGSSPARCSRSATSPRPTCARTRPASGCAPRRSPRAWTSASSPAAVGSRSSTARVPARAGAIVDTGGATVGRHGSVATFTVGQRRGLGVATGERRYVVDVDAAHRDRHPRRPRRPAARRGRGARPALRRRCAVVRRR